MSKFKDFCLQWILSMISSYDSNVDNVVTILSKDLFTGSMYSLAKSVSNVIVPFALTIIGICFLIEFLRITVKMDVLKWEYMMSVFFKLALGKVAIDVAPKLLAAIYATVSEWISGIGNTGSTLGDTISVALEAQIKDMGFWEVLGIMISMCVVFLAIWLIGMIVQVIAYARSFELLAYIAVSPLPSAFILLENSRIPKKFVMLFAGVCLQGLFIILSIKMYSVICSDTLIGAIESTSSPSDIAYNLLLGSLILVVAIVKTGSWGKSVLDAG